MDDHRVDAPVSPSPAERARAAAQDAVAQLRQHLGREPDDSELRALAAHYRWTGDEIAALITGRSYPTCPVCGSTSIVCAGREGAPGVWHDERVWPAKGGAL